MMTPPFPSNILRFEQTADQGQVIGVLTRVTIAATHVSQGSS